MLDYETLRLIWWLLIGIILVAFMVTDGFDMGVGCLLPLIARNDDERRVLINSVGAHWEGNQVWLILAGGALFAAWPRVYAAAFSGFYVAMILVLCALFFRPLAFDYRGKIANARWRAMWDRVRQPFFGRAFYLHSTASCAIPGHLLAVTLTLCPAVRRIKPDAGYSARRRVAPVEDRRHSSPTCAVCYPPQRDAGRALLSVSRLLAMDGYRWLCVAKPGS